MPGTFRKKSLWCVIFAIALTVLVGCEYSSDGPIKPSRTDRVFDGEGFFVAASLDSGSTIHLASDTLLVGINKIWSFSNCALKSIDLNYEKNGDVLWISPTIEIHATEEDCPAPYYRPDTVIKVVLDAEALEGVGQINVRNDKDSTLDTILVRRGSYSLDTFNIYLDSMFSDPKNFPLRTKDKKKGKSVGSVLRVLDSLTPRVFYWKTMKSTCTHRVDICDDVVPDTIYPSSWSLNDTNLVPVHYTCADTNLTYCINTKWENDSSSLGSVQTRPDTIWHYSTYYAEKIPECSAFESFSGATLEVGSTIRFIRKIVVPSDEETFCGPSSLTDMLFYNLPRGMLVENSDSIAYADSLLYMWKKAEIAPDTLIAKED